MPARTNDFQELVALIQKHLMPLGAKVTPSAMLTPEALTTPREVDVLIEVEVGNFCMRIAVEARDESRRFDRNDFDAMCYKYRGEGRVPVDKFVVVSRRGFTKGALEAAKLADVELLTLDEAKQRDWATCQGQLRHKVPAHLCGFDVEPRPEAVSMDALFRTGRIICPHGRDKGTLLEFVRHQVFDHYLQENPTKLAEFERLAREEYAGTVFVHFVAATPGIVVRFENERYVFTKIKASLHIVDAVCKLECTEYLMSSTTGPTIELRCLHGELAGHKFELLMPKDIRRPDRITFSWKPLRQPSGLNRKDRRKRNAQAAKAARRGVKRHA